MNGTIYIAILPVAFLLYYIYKKDVDKEPRGLLIKNFIVGALSTFAICIIELLLFEFYPSSNLPTFAGTFIVTFITISLIEEFGKWFVTYLCSFRRIEFNHSYDGIVYCVFTSLGFAAVENIFYVLSNDFYTGVMRALLAVPGHAVNAVMMGYFLSKAKKALVDNDNKKSLFYLLLSIIIPSLIHGLYDSLIIHSESSSDDIYLLAFFAYVIVSYIISIVIINKYSKITTNFDGSLCVNTNTDNKNTNSPQKQKKKIEVIKRCVNCGIPLNGDECTNCGFKQR